MSSRRPPIIAHHLVWTAYGTWLSNDLRGSGSRATRAPAIVALGPTHFGRKRQQPGRGEVRAFYEQADDLLRFPVVRFGAKEIDEIAAALGATVRSTPYTCYACAIMPDHVHLVIRRHRHRAEEMIEALQEATRLRLGRAELVPLMHPVWTVGGWKTFLDSPSAVRSCIAYVEGNPEREGLPRQAWPFVVTYDGWPYSRGRCS